jgi:Malectin domain
MVPSIEIALPEKRSELDAVLHSREFLRSPALAKLLEYLCEKTFSGNTQEIKEFSIATEVFGRDQDFGERRDSLVRVEVHRLRKKLHRYYETEGADRPVRIVIRSGNYQPDFERVSDPPDGLPNGFPIVISLETSVRETNLSEISSTEQLTAPSPQPAVALDNASWGNRDDMRRFALVMCVAAVLVIAVFVIVRFSKNSSGQSPKTQPVALRSPVDAGGSHPVRILAGSAVKHSIDRFGTEWDGDRYFTGGYQDSLRFGNQERSVPHPIILGAPDQTPFRSFRAGQFSYRIPLAAGKYELRLYFAEVVFGMAESGDGAENQRVFDVYMNGNPLLSYFDIFSDAGGADTADIKVFENVSPAPDGFLKLDFRPLRETAWLNAIELIPNEGAHALPLRIVAKNGNYTNRKGQLWEADRYFIGGKNTSDGKMPFGTDDPDLFSGQRYGHFSYRLPVPPGRYKLRLLFAETFFGADNRGKGGVGSRVFNVYCAGVEILHQFDILKEAGENRAYEKVFHGIVPNAQGRIELTFEPVVNYAVVQGIELTSDGGG